MPQIWMTYDEIAGLLGCSADAASASIPQQCLYLRPLPQGHGSLRPVLMHDLPRGSG